MKLLVDTDVLRALLVEPQRLSKESLELLNAAAKELELCVSVASLLQIREAHNCGQLADSQLESLDRWMLEHRAQVLAIDAKIIASMSRAHREESLVDRLILATARSQECRLGTFRSFEDPDIELVMMRNAEDR